MNDLLLPKPGILDITPYTPGKSAKDDQQKSIKLSSNENPYGPNPKAIKAYQKAATSLHRYPDSGCTELCETIAETHGINARQIICGAGSDELIGMLVHAYAGSGDEILYPEHGFLMYAIYAKAYGATPVESKETNLTADVDNLLAAVTERTKIVFLANPNNPTGSYIPASELMRLRTGLPDNVILCIDGAYAEYVEESDYSNGIELVKHSSNTVITRTFSKIYGMGGIRLGWMFAPPGIIDVLHRVRSPFNVSSAAQAAGIAAMKDVTFITEQRALNKEQMTYLSEALKQIGLNIHPSYGNFILAECADAEHANYLITSLMEENIFIRGVRNYGLPHCMRITVGTPEENQILAETLKRLQSTYRQAM